MIKHAKTTVLYSSSLRLEHTEIFGPYPVTMHAPVLMHCSLTAAFPFPFTGHDDHVEL